MVKAEFVKDKGMAVSISGSIPVIQAELEELIRALRVQIAELSDDEFAADCIKEVVSNAMKSEEEREAECDKAANEEEFKEFKKLFDDKKTSASDSTSAFLKAMFDEEGDDE